VRRNESLRVAVEVCVATLDYEKRNAEKCLAAGYDYVVTVVSNQKKIRLVKEKLQSSIPDEKLSKVKVQSLMDLLAFLRESSGSAERQAESSP